MLSVLTFQPVSWVLGLVDLGFLLPKALGNARPKFFRKGWGDLAVPTVAQDALLSKTKKELKIDIIYNKTERVGNVTVKYGSFSSPLAHVLPTESKMAHFYLVEPIGKPSNVYIIMLPATGEMGKGGRLFMAKQLAAEQGWSSVIVTAPFYAARKPAGQRLFFLDTVSDLLLQSQAVIEEASALACHFLKNDKSANVCVTGFSWGAAMSACVAGTTLLYGGDGTRLACAPYIGSASPVVLVDGVLTSSIDWKALQTERKFDSLAVTQQALYRKLYATQLSDITEPLAKTGNWLQSLHPVSAQDDHFIRRRYVNEFNEQLAGLLRPASSSPAIWLGGGHGTAMFFRSYYQKRAIIAAVNGLIKAK